MSGKEPLCVGVPLSMPFAASIMPAGKVLAVLNATAPIPPVCVKVWLNGVPTVAVLVPGALTVTVWQLIVSVKLTVPIQLFESVTLTVMGKPPVCIGVPLSVPFDANVRPAGRVLAVLKFVVPMPPVCVKVWLNGVPTVPVLVPGALTVMVWQLVVSV